MDQLLATLLATGSLYFNLDAQALVDVINGKAPHTTRFGVGKLKTGQFYDAYIVTDRDDREKPSRNDNGHFRIRLKLQAPKQG